MYNNNNNNNYARRGPYSNTNASYYNRPSSGYGTYNQNSYNRYGSSGMGGMGAMSPYSSNNYNNNYYESSGRMGGYNDNYYGSGGGGGIGGGYYPNNNNYSYYNGNNMNYQYDDHSMRYRNQYQYDSHFDDPYRRTTSAHHRYAAPSSTTSSSSLSNLTAKQDVKRIRYLLLLLSGILTWLGGFVFWRVWKRFLRPLFFSSDRNSRNSGQSGEDAIGSMATVASTTTRTIDLKKNKKLLKQYEQFMDRNDMNNNNNNKFNMGSNEYLDDNDLDDLLQVIQDQYDREDDLKRKNHQKQRKMSKQSLVHKLKRGMIVHQKQLELNVAYLKRIEHMSNEELKQEYERLYKEKTANQSTDLNRENPVEERMDDSKNIIFDYLRRTMANDELQHGENENENENAIQSPFVENNELSMVDKDVNGSSFIRECIEREKNFVSKCQRILQSLYVSAHDDEKKDINTKESTELNDVMSEQFDNDPVIFNDRTRNMDDADEAVVLANR